MRNFKDSRNPKMRRTGNNGKGRKVTNEVAAGDSRKKTGKGEEKDYSIETRRKTEFKENAFSHFYFRKDFKTFTPFIRKDDDGVVKYSAHREVEVYQHRDAVEFAAKTWEWRNSYNEKSQRICLKRSKDSRLLSGSCYYSFNRNNIRAYYRVVSEHEDKYILMACHVNVHGFHRGDLRFIEVNDRTVVKGFDFSPVGKLFLGDIVAVTKLCKMDDEPLEPLPKVHEMGQDSELIWEVANMRVLERHLESSVVFALMKNGSAIAKGYNEAVTVRFDENIPVDLERIHFGKAFIPVKFRSTFLNGYTKSEMRVELLKRCSKISTCPNSLGTIYEYYLSQPLTEQFGIGVEAFKRKHLHSSEEITELCAQMGQSAVLTLFDGRSDSRAFPLQNASKYDNVIRFSIPNPLKHPTEGLWNCNNRIMIEGYSPTYKDIIQHKATIETVLPIEKDRVLLISSRVSRESFDIINLRSSTHVVYQREPKPAVFLPHKFLRRHFSTLNGIQIIRTLYGGPSLQSKAIDFENEECPKYTFPSEPPVPLNDYQNQYVRMITSHRLPMVLGSSPFGCGKSMTIVMAAIEICRKLKFKQQFLITQSNYASVNLIDIARKVKDSDMKIMRYVSVENRKELPEHCRTEFDLPVLMDTHFRKLAYGELPHGKDMRSKEIELILAYLFRDKKRFHLKELCALFKQHFDIEEIRQIPIKRRTRELLEIIMKYYKPNLIVITADTLQAVMSNSEAFSDVSTIQIDEACQLPECTLISLLLLFPEANYGLIGDIKQLPPYCEDDLTGKLKEYGIGNTMERAIEEKMFPEAILRYVYRCHPKITELLSELFYEGKLISGVKEEHRNEFARMRSDIWPNVDYPIICVDNNDKGHRVGTSCANKSEVILVKQILKVLMEKKNDYQLKPTDIGVISFYAAQTAILTDSLRGTKIKCGTVDSFQGSEREVIILCCTNERISEFMQMSNRLNVAMSRARQATIIIGNLKGLSEATYWKTIVQRAEENGALVDTTKYPFRVVPKDNVDKKKKEESQESIDLSECDEEEEAEDVQDEGNSDAVAEKDEQKDEKQRKGGRNRRRGGRKEDGNVTKPTEVDEKGDVKISIEKKPENRKNRGPSDKKNPANSGEGNPETSTGMEVKTVEKAKRNRNRGIGRNNGRTSKTAETEQNKPEKLAENLPDRQVMNPRTSRRRTSNVDNKNPGALADEKLKPSGRSAPKNWTESKTDGDTAPVLEKKKPHRFRRFRNNNDGEKKNKNSLENQMKNLKITAEKK